MKPTAFRGDNPLNKRPTLSPTPPRNEVEIHIEEGVVKELTHEADQREAPSDESLEMRGPTPRSRSKVPIRIRRGPPSSLEDTFDEVGNPYPDQIYSASPSAPQLFRESNS